MAGTWLSAGGLPEAWRCWGAAPAAGSRAGRPGQLLESRLKYPVSLRQSGWVVVLVEALGAEDALPVYEGIGLPTAAAWGRGAVGGTPGGAEGLVVGRCAGSGALWGAPWGVRVPAPGVGRAVLLLSVVLRPAAPSPGRAPAGEV